MQKGTGRPVNFQMRLLKHFFQTSLEHYCPYPEPQLLLFKTVFMLLGPSLDSGHQIWTWHSVSMIPLPNTGV